MPDKADESTAASKPQNGGAGDSIVVLQDARGRQLKMKPLDVLYESRLARMVGPEAATNQAYMMGFVFPAAAVYEIDGVACPPPATQKELDEAITRLGREGIAAVMQRLQEEMEQLQRLLKSEATAT